jgi:mono/diheme cytochrome c family protein
MTAEQRAQTWPAWITGSLTAMLLITASAVQSTDIEAQAAQEFSPQQIALGDQLYRQFCQRCHGSELRNSGASTFDLRTFPAQEYNRFIESVSEGLDSMPPHGDILTEEELDALYAYVVDTQQKPHGAAILR